MPDTPTSPGTQIPSTRGIVAVVGIQPLPFIVDPDHTGVALWNRKPFRDTVSKALFKAVAFFFPKSPWAQVLLQLEPQIEAFISKGAK